MNTAATFPWIGVVWLMIKLIQAIAQEPVPQAEPDKGKEKMTPTYMPPPREAGDGTGSKPKGDTK